MVQSTLRMAENEHAISALVCKRAELSGQIDEAEARIAALNEVVAHVDATLRVFKPDIEVDEIKPKRPIRWNTMFRHGELCRLVLSAIRERSPVTAKGAASAIMASLGMDATYEAPYADILRRVRFTLRDQKKLERVESEQGPGPGQYMVWRIKR